MSTDTAASDDALTRDDFDRALADLIASAHANDVDVRGGWQVSLADGGAELGVEIYRVVRPAGARART